MALQRIVPKRLVAQLLHHVDEGLRFQRAVVIVALLGVDVRLFRRIVHGRGDAVHFVELALDAVGTRGARHARDVQI